MFSGGIEREQCHEMVKDHLIFSDLFRHLFEDSLYN